MFSEITALMAGAIDCHIHGSPDVTERIASDLTLAEEACSAGMKAILIKSHVTPTTSRAHIVQDVVGGAFRVLGGLTLNRQAGGLNVHAVETELQLGAKQIWMPTLSSVNQARFHHQESSNAVAVFDDKDQLLPQVYDILDLIAEYDAVLGTGHIAASESEKLVPVAKQRGVKKILITHPESRLIEMPLEMQKKLARQGAFFERCFFSLAAMPPARLAPELLLEQIQATGTDQSIIATDFGQISNDRPVVGLQKYIQMLIDLKVSTRDIEKMVKTNPSDFLGL